MALQDILSHLKSCFLFSVRDMVLNQYLSLSFHPVFLQNKSQKRRKGFHPRAWPERSRRRLFEGASVLAIAKERKRRRNQRRGFLGFITYKSSSMRSSRAKVRSTPKILVSCSIRRFFLIRSSLFYFFTQGIVIQNRFTTLQFKNYDTLVKKLRHDAQFQNLRHPSSKPMTS